MNEAAKALKAVKAEQSAINAEIAQMRVGRQKLAARISTIEQQWARCAEAADTAAAALAEAIAKHAMGEVADEQLRAAHDAAAAARQAVVACRSDRDEAEHLKRAIASLDQQGEPLARRLGELSAAENRLALTWMNHRGAWLSVRQRELAALLADLNAEAVALNRIAAVLGHPTVYAPINLPSIVLDALGGSGGRIVVDVDSLVPAATAATAKEMQADGFTAVA